MKTAICIGTNGDGVRYAERDAEWVAALLTAKGYDVDLAYHHSDHFYTRHDLLYLAGPADHCNIGRVLLGEDYVDVRELAPHFKGIILDTCKVGRILQPTGTTPALAAAQEYAFEADHPEGGSIFCYWLRCWLYTCDIIDLADWAMHTYIATHVMDATGIQVVKFGLL